MKHYKLRWADAIHAHERALARGGVHGFIDAGLVKAAIERPYSGYYRPISMKVAALVESMCMNHGFTDGNKRTCVILMLLLLDRSGYELVPLHGENIEDSIESMAISVACGQMKFDAIARWAKQRIHKLPAT